MAEDPEFSAHRDDLEAKACRLNEIQMKLDFGGGRDVKSGRVVEEAESLRSKIDHHEFSSHDFSDNSALEVADHEALSPLSPRAMSPENEKFSPSAWDLAADEPFFETTPEAKIDKPGLLSGDRKDKVAKKKGKSKKAEASFVTVALSASTTM